MILVLVYLLVIFKNFVMEPGNVIEYGESLHFFYSNIFTIPFL